MTKSRLKAFLALVVALSLFVCSAVTAFAALHTFYFPYFPSYVVSYRGSDGHFNEYLKRPVSSSPFMSISDSVPSSFDRLYFFLDAASSSSYTWGGYRSGYYTGALVVSSSDPIPDVYFDISAPANNNAYVFDSSVTIYSNVGDIGFIVLFDYFIPSSFSSSSDRLNFKFVFSDLISGSYSFRPSVSPYNSEVVHYSDYTSNYAESIFNSLASGDFNPLSANTFYWFNASLSQNINNSSRNAANMILNEFSSFSSDFFLSLNNLTSYLRLHDDERDDNYKKSVPSGLPGQQQEAQNQLNSYEQKEQQVFDNLNTSLDNLNLNQYQQFDTSIVSAMTFVNRYVTAGFDGLGNFKIILFLPMVIGIGLSVIGRMGAMMSRVSVQDRRGRGP